MVMKEQCKTGFYLILVNYAIENESKRSVSFIYLFFKAKLYSTPG